METGGILLLGGFAACALRTLGSQPLSYTGKPKVSPTPFLVRFRPCFRQTKRTEQVRSFCLWKRVDKDGTRGIFEGVAGTDETRVIPRINCRKMMSVMAWCPRGCSQRAHVHEFGDTEPLSRCYTRMILESALIYRQTNQRGH